MEAPPAFRPLYQQVREKLLNRLIDGTWPPGVPLPSEHQLARELGVSQGTVRKALDALTAEQLLVRAQGRGTFVAEAEDNRILFRYFRLTADDGQRKFPASSVAMLRQRTADAEFRERLQLAKGDKVWVLERTRQLADRPVIVETITVSFDRFPGLDQIDPIPNNVYALYASHFGLTVGRVTEKLKAITASEKDAASLGCKKGTALLRVDRIAYSLRGTPIEWRVSHCLTDEFHYLSEL